MTNSQRFSVIIIHRNDSDLLTSALSHLYQAIDAGRDEVIIVDNGSADDSVSRTRSEFPNTTIIENGCNNGFGRACNQGILASKGRYILLLNNDVVIDRLALDALAAVLDNNPDCAIVSPRLLGTDGVEQRSHTVFTTIAKEFGLGFLDKRKPRPLPESGLARVDAIIGACMAVRRQAIDEAGMLDEDFFFYYEETEWCLRLGRAGWKIMLDLDTTVVHLKGKSTRGVRNFAQIEMYRSRFVYYRKAFGRITAKLLTGYRILRLLLNTAAYTLATILTLGLHAKTRNKLRTYLYIMSWIILLRPDHWGLPDKCPDQR